MTYNIDCTGDCVVGDRVKFEKAVFGGSFRNPIFVKNEILEAEIIKDSYGKDKQQHTFTLRVFATDGQAHDDRIIKMKGRNLYRNGIKRREWEVESKRYDVQDEKHKRGDLAREAKFLRKNQ